MALSKDQKQAQVKELKEKMGSASSIILAHYIGLSVTEVSELRNSLRENEAEMKVAKKTLMKIATKEAGLPEFNDESMEGPVSMIFSFGDPLLGAQVAFKFSKDHDKVKILGGLYDGKILSGEEALELAKMPSRDILLATFVGMLRAPLTGFAGICSSPLSGFARALSELAEKGGANPVADAPTPETKDEAPAEEVKKEEEPKEETEEKAETPADEPDSSEPAEEESSDSEKTDS